MSCWALLSGHHNPTDWLTRGRTPVELNQHSHWWNGLPILYEPIEECGLKFGLQKEESLPREKMCNSAAATADHPLIDFEKFSATIESLWSLQD